MAGKHASRLSYWFLSQSHKTCLSNPHFNLRLFSKKVYNYDLDSLIEWNKETSLAFGSPVKLTKSGKISKSRKKFPDEKLKDSLEALNAMSASVIVSHNDEYIVEKIPTKLDQRRKRKGEKTRTDEDIPNYCLEDIVPDTGNLLSASFMTDVPEKTPHKEMTEDGIYIPEIKPVPQHTSNTKVRRSNKLIFQSVNNINNFGIEKMSGSVPSSKLQRYNTEQNDLISEKGSNHGLSSNPKRTSLETTSTQVTSVTPASKSDSSSSQLDLPAEPPQSFSLITEFPFACGEEERMTLWSSKIHAFKLDAGKLCLKTVPPVKTILNKTMSELNRFFLNRWREGMVKELGEEGFKLHQEATIKRGINLHANIMELLSGKPESEIQVMPDNEGHWASLQSAISLISDVQALETDVKHPFLIYRGVFDCLAKYKDLLCIVDWKSSKKPRPLLKNTYDDPLQIAAYVGAMNAVNATGNHAQEINHGVIVVAYPDGSPAHIHMMNRKQCEQYWRDWTERLYNYYQLLYTSKFG